MPTITIQGTAYPVRMTMGAFRRFKQTTGHDVSQIGGDLSDLCTLIYCATASACNADGVPFALSPDDFADHLSVQQVQTLSAALMDEKKTTPTA